jgi:hypothetical protein
MLQDSYDYNCDYSIHTTGLKYDHDFKMGLDTKTDRQTDRLTANCYVKYVVRLSNISGGAAMVE